MLLRCTPSVSRPTAVACLGKAPARLHASRSSSTPSKSPSVFWGSSLAGRQAAAGKRGVAVCAGTASADGEKQLAGNGNELQALPELYAVDHAINDVDVHIMLSGSPAAAQLLKTVPVSSLLLASHSRVLLAAATATSLDAAGSGGGDSVTAATASEHVAAAGKGQHQGRRSVEVLVGSAEAAEAVETCLRFMYSGAVPAQVAEAASLEAQRLGMWPCHYACAAALVPESLSHLNHLSSQPAAYENALRALRLPAVLRHFGSTALIRDNSAEWKQLQLEVVRDILHSDAFAAGSEDEVLDVMELWLQRGEHDQQTHAQPWNGGLLRQLWERGSARQAAIVSAHAQQLLPGLRLLQLGSGNASSAKQRLHALMQWAGSSTSTKLVDLLVYQNASPEQRTQLAAGLPPAWLRTDPRPTQLALPPPP